MTDPQEREERPWQAAQHIPDISDAPNHSALQARGQALQAARLAETARRLQQLGFYGSARQARHQANRLRAALRGAA